jgi:hypothetical protein
MPATSLVIGTAEDPTQGAGMTIQFLCRVPDQLRTAASGKRRKVRRVRETKTARRNERKSALPAYLRSMAAQASKPVIVDGG